MNSNQMKELEARIIKDYTNITGIVINKEGQNIFEHYFNDCTPESNLHVYSVTKSIVSILIGIALDKGYVTSIDQNVLDFFPNYKVKPKEKIIQKIKLKHLLTMTSPYKYKLFTPYIKYFISDDWVKFSLDLIGGRGTIGKFRYTPLIGPDILSGILYQVTGKSVLEFANEHLFNPLDIKPKSNIIFETKEEQIAFNKANNINGWVADSKGTNSAGWGLTLSARDMAKIGQLLLDKGIYKSKNIVSKNWLNSCTSVHSKWDKHNLSYGLLWWIIDENKGIYAAMGDGGNTIYVNSSKNIVVSINSMFSHRVKDRIDFIQKYIENLL
jgi:CubicO group peptidase (beta-lactamase class C family)